MASSGYGSELASSLEKAGLVPGPAAGLIPEGFKPGTELAVSYAGKAVKLGTFFRVNETKVQPSLYFQAEDLKIASANFELPVVTEKANATGKENYTIILTDPDAPTPDDPKFAFWRHWVVPGLQPLSGGETTVAQTKHVLTEYLGPGPKDDSKPHRYLFLLYREPEGLDLSKDDVGGEEFVQRRSFKPSEFAEKHGLLLVGVNWMTVAGDGWTE